VLYGIIADIHSNLEALQAILPELRGVDQIICLGDIVGYGPNPNECLEVIRQNRITTIAGNHDKAAVGELQTTNFNPNARRAIGWTAEQLTEANKHYLTNLPLTLEFPEFQVVHGSLAGPLEEYIFSLAEAAPTFDLMGKGLLFVGHTHQPLNLTRENKIIVNPGSVGQPRDNDPRASFGIYDSVKHEFAWHRVAYDISAVQEKMRAAGLPKFLADRLATGS